MAIEKELIVSRNISGPVARNYTSKVKLILMANEFQKSGRNKIQLNKDKTYPKGIFNKPVTDYSNLFWYNRWGINNKNRDRLTIGRRIEHSQLWSLLGSLEMVGCCLSPPWKRWKHQKKKQGRQNWSTDAVLRRSFCLCSRLDHWVDVVVCNIIVRVNETGPFCCIDLLRNIRTMAGFNFVVAFVTDAVSQY